MRDSSPSPAVAFHGAVAQPAVRFGPFKFDWRDQVLTRDGVEVRLPPRALAILAYLLERPGRVVSKHDLIDAVWKDAFVSETSLTEAMGVLRQALGDTAAAATYIQTVHRRGYRFVATLTVDAPPVSTLSAVPDRPAVIEAPPTRKSRTWWIVGAAALAVMAAGTFWVVQPGPQSAPVTRATITLPESVAPAPGLSASTVAALSPDGRRIVYVAGSTGSYRLYLRALDRFDALPIPGTDGAHGAFFSPSGDAIGFFRGGRVFVSRLPDGQPLDLGAAGAAHGGWWHTDNTIVIATGTTDGIVRLAADGGRRTPVATGDLNPASLRHPSVTADGRTLLVTVWGLNVRESHIAAVDLTTGVSRVITRGVHPRSLTATDVVYLLDGQLTASALSGSGTPRPLLAGVMTGVGGAGQYALSAAGTLLYLPDSPTRMLRRLVRVNLDGSTSALPFELRAFQNIAVSPDGSRIATTIYDRGASDLWVGDIARGTLQRLTSEGGTIEPVWSRDGRHIFFASTRSGAYRIYRIAADGTGQAAAVSAETAVMPTAAGAGVLLAQRMHATGGDLIRLDEDGAATDWVIGPGHDGLARLSPDGRWVAYESNRSGRLEAYLRALDGSVDVALTNEGGGAPFWAPDGRAVYAVSQRRVVRIPVVDGLAGLPTSVRTDPAAVLVRAAGDGLIAVHAIEEARPLTTLHVVVNWLTEARSTGR